MTRTRRSGLAIVIAGGLLVLGLILLVLITVIGSQQTCSSGGQSAVGGPPSAQGRKAIPVELMPIYLRAQAQYGVPWNLLAAINYVETNFGRGALPGVHSGANYAGAMGPMQFLASTWASFDVDGNGDGRKDVYDPADAIPAAAGYLKASGAPADLRRAVFAYNHADWYVDEVLAEAKALTEGATLVASTSSGADCSSGAVGPANLDKAVQLSSPRSYTPLPAWAMSSGRAPEPIDTRILPDALWVLRRYGLRVTAAREAGHHTHGDGTALDMVPARGSDQAAWDTSAKALALDLGWTPQCASAGVAPVCHLKPAIHGVFYNGYPGHGDPAHCSGGCGAHIHVSWYASHFGAAGLVAPNAWVRVFPVPAPGSGSAASAASTPGAGASL